MSEMNINPKESNSRRKKGQAEGRRSICCVLAAVSFPLGIVVGMHIASVGFLRSEEGVVGHSKGGLRERKLESPRRGLPTVPTGPPTQTYLDHSHSTAKFGLAYDSHQEGIEWAKNVSVTETLILGAKLQEIQRHWTDRAKRFRRYLTDLKLNNVDVVSEADKAPFARSLDTTEIHEAALGDSSSGYCPCDLRRRPVVDMALVVPLEMHKYPLTWALLESIRQLTVFPKELVFVMGNTAAHRPIELMAFLSIIKDFYIPDWPDLMHVKVFVSARKTKPGDSRWFGFNQTTAEIVTLFDNDDYMHPLFFHIFWRIFHRRPELDFALMRYEAGAVDGECSEDMFFPSVGQFLTRRQFSEQEIHVGESYADSRYAELWGLIPTFNKTWWLGNTDAEPNWENPDQRWWDMGCHNGWATFRRYVMAMVPPPVGKFGGEDAIWNYRVGRAQFNYRCIELEMGSFLKSFCTEPRPAITVT